MTVDDLKVKDVDQADQKGIAPRDKDVDRAGLKVIDQKAGDVDQADLRVKDATGATIVYELAKRQMLVWLHA